MIPNPTPRRLLLAVATLGTTLAVLQGCTERVDEPVLRYTVRLEADAHSPQECRQDVALSFDPVSIAPQVPSQLYQMTAFSNVAQVTSKPEEDGTGNWECWHTFVSPALSPGKWKIVGEFTGASQGCLRDVQPGMPNQLIIDQEDGCVEPKAPLPLQPT